MANNVNNIALNGIVSARSATIRNTFELENIKELDIAAQQKMYDLGVVSWFGQLTNWELGDYEFFGSKYPLNEQLSDIAKGGTLTFSEVISENGLYVYAPTSANPSLTATHGGIKHYSIMMGGNIAKGIFLDFYGASQVAGGEAMILQQLLDGVEELARGFHTLVWLDRIKKHKDLSDNHSADLFSQNIETKVQAANEFVVIEAGGTAATATQYEQKDARTLYFQLTSATDKMLRYGYDRSQIRVLLDPVPFGAIKALGVTNIATGLINVGEVIGESLKLPNGVEVFMSDFKDLVYDTNPTKGTHKPVLGYIGTYDTFIAPKFLQETAFTDGGHFRGQKYAHLLLNTGKEQIGNRGEWKNIITMELKDFSTEIFILGTQEIKAIGEKDNPRYNTIKSLIPIFYPTMSLDTFARLGTEGYGSVNKPTLDDTDIKSQKFDASVSANRTVIEQDGTQANNEEDGTGSSLKKK